LLILDHLLEDLDLRCDFIRQIRNFLEKNWGPRFISVGPVEGEKPSGKTQGPWLPEAAICASMGQADARLS
jgi:hypothetical protein